MDFPNALSTLVRNDQGQDLLEYALLVALIALICVGAVALAGTKVSALFASVADRIPPGK